MSHSPPVCHPPICPESINSLVFLFVSSFVCAPCCAKSVLCSPLCSFFFFFKFQGFCFSGFLFYLIIWTLIILDVLLTVFLFSWTFSFLDSKLANKELAFVYRLPLCPAFGSSLVCNPHAMTLPASQCLQTLINLKNKPHKVKSLSDYSELFRMDFDKCLYHFALRMFTCREAKPEACTGKQFQHTHRICMISIFTYPDACSQNKP